MVSFPDNVFIPDNHNGAECSSYDRTLPWHGIWKRRIISPEKLADSINHSEEYSYFVLLSSGAESLYRLKAPIIPLLAILAVISVMAWEQKSFEYKKGLLPHWQVLGEILT